MPSDQLLLPKIVCNQLATADIWSALGKGCAIEVGSIGETKRVAESLAQALEAGTSLGFSGTLGAGKTIFVKLLVEALGSLDAVSSPTYGLMNEYAIPGGGVIEHWDLYRLSSGLDELFEPVLCEYRIIEWPERVADVVPLLDIHIQIDVNEDETRLIYLRRNHNES